MCDDIGDNEMYPGGDHFLTGPELRFETEINY